MLYECMNTIAAISLVLALMPAVSTSAHAVEIAPFTGHRYGGGFQDTYTLTNLEIADNASFGVLLDFDSEPDKQIEVFLSRQNAQISTAGTFTGNPLFDLTIDYIHIGGIYMPPDFEQVRPFVSGTFGDRKSVV